MNRFLLVFAFLVFSFAGFAQTTPDEKLSITTQLFLNELDGKIDFRHKARAATPGGNLHIPKATTLPSRLYAEPDTIDGKVYASCFVRLENSEDTREIENLGVIVQCKFMNGLVTALIPVENINEVAKVANVRRINVSPLMKPLTDAARQDTHVDDLLAFPDDARKEGLSKRYDGSGVLLAVIDDGIDFQHIAFKDKDGNSRIKRAYVYNGSREKEYESVTSTTPTTDDSYSDHGTHTSTTAGGSSVIINGSSVTVTDDHAHSTYGGMAPGADLYLAGVKGLKSTYLSNAMDKIIAYADSHEMPVVVSNSWGSSMGTRDGSGDFTNVTSKYFGSTHPNHVCLFASSNDGGRSKDGEGGGCYLTGTASKNNPLASILRSDYYIDTDGGCYYYGVIADVWCRSTNVSSMACKVHVIDLEADPVAVVASTTVTPTTGGVTVSGLGSYFSGNLYALKDYISADKTQLMLYTDGLTSLGCSKVIKDGEAYWKSRYTLAVEFYPTSGTNIIDAWGGDYCYFTDYAHVNGYNWTAGSDDMSVSDEATDPNVISIGAHVTKNIITDYKGVNYDYNGEFTMGDIAYFSSYATPEASLTGQQYPWVTAPGARLVAGVNHYSSSYTTGDFSYDRVNANTTYPYAAMQGTSMATPTAAGIVALWLQAAKEVGKVMTNDDIKEVMRLTATNDYYTTQGPNASHFGHGKINALAGIKYILGATNAPVIHVSSDEVAFEGYATMTYTKTIHVEGLNLKDDLVLSLSDQSHSYAMDIVNISAAEAANGVDVTITWSPETAGQSTATLTLTSTGADNVVVTIHGTADAITPVIIADVSEVKFNGNINQDYTNTINVSGRFLSQDVNVNLYDPNGVFSVIPNVIPASEMNDGATLTVNFNAATDNSFSGSITLTSEGAEAVVISLAGVAQDGGAAADEYLNIAKYKTIDTQGWRTQLVDSLYHYTEYKDEKVAWLTLPVYGAFVGAKYLPNSGTFGAGTPQKWIQTNITSIYDNPYAGTSWDHTPTISSPYRGSSTYFKTANARVIGSNSKRATTTRTVTFHVTNTTEVKLYGISNTTDTRYSPYLKIYECEKSDDGTLTDGTKPVKEHSSTIKGTVDFDAEGLDANKVYKVEVGVCRGYLYEVAFKTPVTVKIKGDVNRDGKVDVGDITALVDLILEGDFTPPYKWPNYDREAANVNEDEFVNVGDVTMLVDIILSN